MKHVKRGGRKKVALWVIILVIILVFALPLFFSYYRYAGLQQIFSPQGQPTSMGNMGKSY